MDYKYRKLLRGIGTEGEGGGKREKDVELPRHARQLTTSEYDVVLVRKEIYRYRGHAQTCTNDATPWASQASMQCQQTYVNVTSAHVHDATACAVRPWCL